MNQWRYEGKPPQRILSIIDSIPLLRDLFGPPPDPMALRCPKCGRILRNTVITSHGVPYTVKACPKCLPAAYKKYQKKEAKRCSTTSEK